MKKLKRCEEAKAESELEYDALRHGIYSSFLSFLAVKSRWELLVKSKLKGFFPKSVPENLTWREVLVTYKGKSYAIWEIFLTHFQITIC